MQHEEITKDIIESIPVPSKNHSIIMFNKVVKGLGVRTTPYGVKSFIMRYTFEGKKRIYTICNVTETRIPALIKRAQVLRGRIADGEDIQATRQQKRELNQAQETIHQAIDRILERYIKPSTEIKPSTYKMYEYHLNKYAKPYFNERFQFNALNAAEMEKFKINMSDKQAAFNNTYDALNAVYKVAIRLDELKDNAGVKIQLVPYSDVKKYKKRRRYVMWDNDDVTRIVKAIEKEKQEGNRVLAMWATALMYTGCRRNEMAKSEVKHWTLYPAQNVKDEQGTDAVIPAHGTLYLPAENRKGSQSIKLPLAPDLVEEMLEYMEWVKKNRKKASRFMFAGWGKNIHDTGVDRPINKDQSKFWKRLKEEAKIEELHPHLFRHDANTTWQSTRDGTAPVNLKVAASLAGHASTQSTLGYTHPIEEERLQGSLKVSRRIQQAKQRVAVNAHVQAGNVVKLF